MEHEPTRDRGVRPPEEDLGYLLPRAGLALGDELSGVVRAHGMSLRGFTVLSALATGGPPTSIALAERLGIAWSAVNLTLNELEDDGLLERVADPADRRTRRLEPTPAGRAARAAAQRDVEGVHERVLAALPEPARPALIAALQALVGGPLEERGDARVRHRRGRGRPGAD